MSLSAAIDTLALVSVTGVTKSYGLDDIKRGVAKPNLPALLPLPATGEIGRETFGIATTSYGENHIVRHRLLAALVQTSNQGPAIGQVVDLIDAYLAAIQVLSAHSGALDVVVDRYEAGLVEWQGVQYHGCDFMVRLYVSD